MKKSTRCSRLKEAEFSTVAYYSEITYRKSSVGRGFDYLHPLEGWKNHLIWRYSSTQPPYPDLDLRIRRGVECEFNMYPGDVIISTSPRNPNYMWRCPELNLDLAWKLILDEGFSENLIAIKTSQRLIFVEDTDLEYCLLCRDPTVYPDPFPGVTDEALRLEFWEQELGTLDDDTDVAARHINSEILPYTVEMKRG